MFNFFLKANKAKLFTLALVLVVVFGAFSLPFSVSAEEGSGEATSVSESALALADSPEDSESDSADTAAVADTADGEEAAGEQGLKDTDTSVSDIDTTGDINATDNEDPAGDTTEGGTDETVDNSDDGTGTTTSSTVPDGDDSDTIGDDKDGVGENTGDNQDPETQNEAKADSETEENSSEYSFNAADGEPEEPPATEDISLEYSFTTLSDTNPEPTPNEEISREYDFNTLGDSGEPSLEEENSREYSFTTLSDTESPLNEDISNEYNFTTSGDIEPPIDEEISREYSFTTLSDTNLSEEISNEYSFTTLRSGGGEESEEEISREYSFTTPDGSPLDEEVSAEYSFTTSAGEGCTENCGGGGGGGQHRKKPKDQVLPTPCVPLLYKYIRLGANNDPFEVYKLQWFLRTFEGLEVPLSGFYDQTTFEAVKIFQARHASDVLYTWGITEPTGYVYITTQLMVNYIYCDIDEPIRLELELPTRPSYSSSGASYKLPGKGDGLEYLVYPPATVRGESLRGLSLDLPDEIDKKAGNFIQLATIGFADWLAGVEEKNWWWLVLIPLIIFFAYLYRLFNERAEEKNLITESGEMMAEAEREINAVPLEGAGAETTDTKDVPDEIVAEYNAANGGADGNQGTIALPGEGESMSERES